MINGTYKNNLLHGKIFFQEEKLNRTTSCTYKKGKPQNGVVISNHVFTTYKNGLKHGVEKKITDKGQVDRITEHNKGNILSTTWPNETKEKTITGTFKNNHPYNGYFLEFKNALASLTHYKEGIIIGNQYQGYNDNEYLIPTDTLTYKLGKPYHGSLLEHHENDRRFHSHKYDKEIRTKTIVTRDNLKRNIRNTVIYDDSGFNIYEKENLHGVKATYLNKEKTKVKVVFSYDTFNGFVEYNNNKITAIDINYLRGSTEINYALLNNKLLVTKKTGNDFLVKAYPKVTSISYKNFLDIEHLFMEEEVLYETYIDNKKVAEGITKNRDIEGGHLFYYPDENTYRYYKSNKSEKVVSKRDLTKEALLKLLNTK